jgi:hypothetical protein
MANSGSFRKGEKRPKQGKHGPPKATLAAREAIARFVDGNAHRLQGWLDQVAEGVKDEEGDFVVKPDPEKAYTLFQAVIEYHVPKLARTEHTGKDGGAIVVQGVAHDDNL